MGNSNSDENAAVNFDPELKEKVSVMLYGYLLDRDCSDIEIEKMLLKNHPKAFTSAFTSKIDHGNGFYPMEDIKNWYLSSGIRADIKDNLLTLQLSGKE